MRCLSLAHMLRKAGHQVHFCSRPLSGNIINTIVEKQFIFHPLPIGEEAQTYSENYETWLGTSMEDEIKSFSSIIQRVNPDWIIADHYSINQKWENSVKDKNIKLFVIDDLFRPHNCDGFLDQNSQIDHDKKTHFIKGKKFLGPQYALLSEKFLELSPPKLDLKKIKNITVFFGGSDPKSQTLRFLKNFSSIVNNEQHFRIIIGKFNPDLETIKAMAQAKDNIEVFIQTNDMPNILRATDLFIGAGGTISWEKTYFGIPSICISVAENQVSISQSLHDMNIHNYLGKAEDVKDQTLIQEVNNLIFDENKRRMYSENSLKLEVSSKLPEVINFFSCL